MLAKSEQKHRFESHLASELGWSASGQSGHQLHGMQPLVVIRGGLIIRRGGGRALLAEALLPLLRPVHVLRLEVLVRQREPQLMERVK